MKTHDDFIDTLSAEKIAEIHALLDQSEKYIEQNGLSGMMTLEEFKEHMDKKLGRDKGDDLRPQKLVSMQENVHEAP